MIEKVSKIRIFVLKQDTEKLFKLFDKFSCVDIEEIERQNLDLKLVNDIKKIENLLDKANLLYVLIKEKNNKSHDIKYDKSDLTRVILNVSHYLEYLKDLETKRDTILQKLKELEKFKDLGINSKSLKKSSLFAGIILEGNIKNHSLFQKVLRDKILFKKIGEDKKREFYLYLFLKKDQEMVNGLVKKFNLIQHSIPDFNPQKKIQKLQNKLELINIKINLILDKVNSNMPPLELLEEFINSLKFKIRISMIMKKLPKTEKFFIFEAWIPSNNLENFRKELEKELGYNLVEEIKFNPEEAPILLKNKFSKFFEPITKLYGLPKYTEPDPTPFFAPFFVLFFGMALSDAGYGLVLVVISLILMLLQYKLKNNIPLIDYWPILFLLGLSTVIFGIILGTFFGRNLVLWMDPAQEAWKALMLCFALGIFQIIFGLLIKFFHGLYNGKELLKSLAEDFSFIPILFILWLYLIQDIFSFSLLSKSLFLKIITYLVLFKLLLHILSNKSFIRGIISFLSSAYNSISFVSDTLSYSRLFALGLATGVIASTINLVAVIFRDLVNIPVLSFVIFILILIIGHLFNLAINIVGAFIHSARLQFVEFFSKFIEGGGRQFKAFKIK